MKRYEKYNKIIDDLRTKAEADNLRIAYHGKYYDNSFYVEFSRDYTKIIKRFLIIWDKDNFIFHEQKLNLKRGVKKE